MIKHLMQRGSCIRDRIDASPRAAWLSSRATGLFAAAALVMRIGVAAPAAAHAVAQPAAVRAYTLTPRRIGASLAVVVALIGAIVGGRAKARTADGVGAANGRGGAIAALVLGPIGLVGGGLVVATAKGGLGTGNGLGGGVVAMVVGLIGMTFGGLALVRSRHTG
jgi:hypothetical protein